MRVTASEEATCKGSQHPAEDVVTNHSWQAWVREGAAHVEVADGDQPVARAHANVDPGCRVLAANAVHWATLGKHTRMQVPEVVPFRS